MRLLFDKYLNIAVDTIVLACISLAWHVDDHTFCYTGRNVDLSTTSSPLLHTSAIALLTLVLDYLTFAAADRTDALLLHHAEDALGGVGDITLVSVTGGALLLAAASLGTASHDSVHKGRPSAP